MRKSLLVFSCEYLRPKTLGIILYFRILCAQIILYFRILYTQIIFYFRTVCTQIIPFFWILCTQIILYFRILCSQIILYFSIVCDSIVITSMRVLIRPTPDPFSIKSQKSLEISKCPALIIRWFNFYQISDAFNEGMCIKINIWQKF